MCLGHDGGSGLTRPSGGPPEPCWRDGDPALLLLPLPGPVVDLHRDPHDQQQEKHRRESHESSAGGADLWRRPRYCRRERRRAEGSLRPQAQAGARKSRGEEPLIGLIVTTSWTMPCCVLMAHRPCHAAPRACTALQNSRRFLPHNPGRVCRRRLSSIFHAFTSWHRPCAPIVQGKEDHAMRRIHSTWLGVLVGIPIVRTAALTALVWAGRAGVTAACREGRGILGRCEGQSRARRPAGADGRSL